jgi:hypothetical protein
MGGVMVNMLVFGPKVRRFKSGCGDGFLKTMKVYSTPSFGWEVKPLVPTRETLRHVKELYKL